MIYIQQILWIMNMLTSSVCFPPRVREVTEQELTSAYVSTIFVYSTHFSDNILTNFIIMRPLFLSFQLQGV